MFFLSCPYSGDEEVKKARLRSMCEIDGKLNHAGFFTVTPLYKHLLFLNGVDLPTDWAYWGDYSKELLRSCSGMIVITMTGWEASTGVSAEIAFAKQNDIPVLYLSEADDCVEIVKRWNDEISFLGKP